MIIRMHVPFIDLKREWHYFEKKMVKAFQAFGRRGVYVLGPDIEHFEKNFARALGYPYAISVATGLAALEIALRAHGIKDGDEVITVANSAVATSLAITETGATPVFCDVGNDFLIDTKKIEKLITKKTKAILPVHLFGKICAMAAINKLAKKHNLVVIEDACQAHGADFKGASTRHTKAFSFYPTKNVGALGEGGMIVTRDKSVRDFAVSYRNYGQKERYDHVMRGANYRLEPLHAVLLDIKLPRLRNFIAERQKIARTYITGLRDLKPLLINNFDPTGAYHLFVIRVQDGKRDALQQYLLKNGIESLVHYPTAIHKQPCFTAEGKKATVPHTDELQKEILSLPCYPFLKVAEQQHIIYHIRNYFLPSSHSAKTNNRHKRRE